MSNEAGNRAPLRQRVCGHQSQSLFGQRRGRSFFMDHSWVGPIVFSDDGANGFEMTGLLSHEEIMEMQCDLLTSNPRDSEAISLVTKEMKEKIKSIQNSKGSLSHCAGSLILGLRRAFEQKKNALGVKLRCSNRICSKCNTHFSYLSARSNGTCFHCGTWMYCVGCGSMRTGTYASCNSCRKRFV